ncbi:conserved protein of unknown function [Acidithiobacillus ferrivorans]|uniref:Uncharacterized protein n=3 Tax=Acidithiobacillus ferrivorans TaxID=160808 RepID=A0A060V005_9PROT|nr:hypothetical protein [Acidithiobacillus ferrivorans]AEM48552.1 hypothetical protein Acife_2458 [Acidithiobacillus ferrivorans SS3]MBN6742125.1 hypothetical protein [Acidithiobacillus sp. MC6.1]MBU2849976.1 hypothetical protein [Acidithiobacillus ferrivorans]OCB03542.1 hypothetical protein BBC27_07415 [Acidithiobacillus ferrivorans]OFA15572.1 hypothetical protein A4U49_12370 [Acidithiobacillus ferrivorans]
MSKSSELISTLDAAHERIEALARQQVAGMALPELVAAGVAEAAAMLRIMLAAEHKPYASDADLLELWKTLVKGLPHWNTIRDNCRELVYYQNCLNAERADALPAQPERMVIHTLRHIFLYMRSHAEQNHGGKV